MQKNKIIVIQNGQPVVEKMTKKGFQLVTIGSDQRYMTAASKSALSKLKKDQKKTLEKAINLNELSRLYAHIYEQKTSYLCRLYKQFEKRITLHNTNKGAKFTRGRKWKLIYKEKHSSKKEAISREYYIKNNKTLRKKLK